MKHYFIAAGMMMAASIAVAGTVSAADLNDRYGRSDQTSSPYSDPRYAEIYGRTVQGRIVRRDAEPFRDYTRQNYAGDDHSQHDHDADNRCMLPRTSSYGSYKDDGRYRSRNNRKRRYSRTRNCLSKNVIRANLRDDGWHAFELIKVRKNTGILKARQTDGDLYRINVDRCTGDIVKARLLRRYRGDAYAYRNSRRLRTY